MSPTMFRMFCLLLVFISVVPQIYSQMTEEEACDVLCGGDEAENAYYTPRNANPLEIKPGKCYQMGGRCTKIGRCPRGSRQIPKYCGIGQGNICCVAR